MGGTQGGHPAITFQRTSSLILIVLEGVLPFHTDGGMICYAGKKLSIEIFTWLYEGFEPLIVG